MSLICNVSGDDFLAGLSFLQNAVSKKGTIAILSNILIESKSDSLLLTATDLEIGIRKIVSAEIISQGSITLPAKKLLEIVRQSGAEQIHIEVLENCWANISADSTDYKLAGMAATEYPTFPEYNEENLVDLDSELIKELIDKTIFSVAQEGEAQFNLTGVLVERGEVEGHNSLKMVSSDGHRLSFIETAFAEDISRLNMEKTILIPRKGVQEIRKLSEFYPRLMLGFEEKQAVIKTENTLIIIRLLNGDFPDYRNIFNVINKEKHLVFQRIPLMNSLKKINLFTEDRYNAVRFDLAEGKLTLSSHSMDIGSAKDELAVHFTGDPLCLGFNGRYFVDTLQVMASENIRAYISSEESPCMIEGDEDPGFVSVIMPMKI